MDTAAMTNGHSVPVSGDLPYGAINPVTARDRAHRQEFVEYVLHDAKPWHRVFLTRLYDLYFEWNDRYFDGKLLWPYMFLSEPKAPTVYGDCAIISGFGGGPQIRLRPSLLRGTHPHMREEEEFAEGRVRFVADVLLHEMIHQWQQEVSGETEAAYHGHGPDFRDACNRIGADLGLPPVRDSKKRGPDKELPSCAQWPHNVRPLDYYLGAYVPPEKKQKDPLAAAEAALIQSAVAFGDTREEEPDSEATRESAADVLTKALVLRAVARDVPTTGDTPAPDVSGLFGATEKQEPEQREMTDIEEENEALRDDSDVALNVTLDAVYALLHGKSKDAYRILIEQLARIGMVAGNDLPFLGQVKLSNKAECQKAEELLRAET